MLIDIENLLKTKQLWPLSLKYKESNSKLTISINKKKDPLQDTWSYSNWDNFNTYLSSHNHHYFADLCNKNEEMVCLIEYSIPKDIKKNDILHSDLIRISPTIRWLWISIQKIFHNAAASYGFKYIIWYQVSSYLSKYFCKYGDRVRLVSLPLEIQSYLCDSPESYSKCTVVLLDKINTQ